MVQENEYDFRMILLPLVSEIYDLRNMQLTTLVNLKE